MAQSLADVVEFIGTPFEYGGRGPETYDCYGLLMELFARDGHKIKDFRRIDDLQAIAETMRGNMHLWQSCELKPGCGILFRIKGIGAHVGYYLGNGQFVHTWEKSGGVLVEPLDVWKHRIMGFYEYVGKED